MRNISILISLALLSGCGALNANHSGVRGEVDLHDGKDAANATVTLIEADGKVEHSIFADSAGRFHFTQNPGPGWQIRAWVRGVGVVQMPIADASKALTLRLSATDPRADAVTTDEVLGLLPDGDMRREFIINCATCHTMNGARILPEGQTRSVENWHDAIKMMRAMDIYENIPPDFDDAEYAKWLNTHLTKEAIAKLPPPARIAPEIAAKVEITEYAYPDQSELPHDLVVGEDGLIWLTGFFAGNMLSFDPKTRATKTYPVNGDKAGGDVRALKFGPDGRLWIVLGSTQSLVALDTKTGDYKSYKVNMYAHDVEIDSKGNAWVNDYFGKPERIASFNPAQEKLTEYTIPGVQLTAKQGKPLPYGLQVDKEDILWGSQLAGNTMFRFDPKTGKTTYLDMPQSNSGPRRLALGVDGTIWIPEWATGYLTGLNPKTLSFTRHKISTATAGLYDAEVDPRTGVVWVTGSLASTLIRFDPKTGKHVTIPLPSEPAFMRHIAIDPHNGDVWTAYSMLPMVAPKIVRLRYKD